jgi:hypothetical protein
MLETVDVTISMDESPKLRPPSVSTLRRRVIGVLGLPHRVFPATDGRLGASSSRVPHT